MPFSRERYDSSSGSPERIRGSPRGIFTLAGKTTPCALGHSDLEELNRRFSLLVLDVDPTVERRTTSSAPGKPGASNFSSNPEGQ